VRTTLQRFRAGLSLVKDTPRPRRGILKMPDLVALQQLVREHDTQYLDELCANLAARIGKRVSPRTMLRALHTLGLTCKRVRALGRAVRLRVRPLAVTSGTAAPWSPGSTSGSPARAVAVLLRHARGRRRLVLLMQLLLVPGHTVARQVPHLRAAAPLPPRARAPAAAGTGWPSPPGRRRRST
jgi:hypothetical protein